MTMTPEETIRVQAGFNELRQQRDVALDRCANLVQELAVRDAKISALAEENGLLVKCLGKAETSESLPT